jgi:hypothetical protein
VYYRGVIPEDAKRIGDWRWRLTHLYKIRTKKAGEKVLFTPKPAQLKILKVFPFWKLFIVLKARQVGISTLFLLWHLDATMFTPNTTTCILAHRKDSLKKLFRIIKIAYESCPAAIQLADGRVWHKPKAKYDNANELYFEGLDSTIYVALEARSDTVHRLHVSEAAHIKNAEDVLTATLGAVPDDGVVTMESTANGMGGLFYELWSEAEEGNSQYLPCFVGYQDDPDYCDEVEDPKALEPLSEREQTLVRDYHHTLGNIAWLRRRLSNAAARKKFAQEFPANAEEAFLTTGRSPFDREKIKEWITRTPIQTKMEGRLLYWVMPIEGRRYMAACDTASGRGVESLDQEDQKDGGTDYDVIQIWDCETLQLCAMFRGKWPYSKLHEPLFDLAREYNKAYVAVEATDHGLTVINNFVRDFIDTGKYPRTLMHTTQYIDDKSKKPAMKWGFYTNLKTRPVILDLLAEHILEETIRCYSKKVQSEALRFIIDDNGDMHAMDQYHDDTILTAAIALYLIPNALRAVREAVTKKDLGLK